MNFAQRLRKTREENALTQKELAIKLGCSEKTISGYERGDRSPKKDTLNKLANILNVSVDYLLNGTNNFIDKDEKDIAKTMEKIKHQLVTEQGLMFDGEALDEETAKLLLEAIEQQERMVKAINKKYTPKKYR